MAMKEEPVNRYKLVGGPYKVPPVRIGQRVTCRLNGRLKVTGWSDGRIPWPRARVHQGGKGAFVMTEELVRAVRTEAGQAICFWWGVGTATVTLWRRALGVRPFNIGTQLLYSAWKPIKLPEQKASLFSPAGVATTSPFGGAHAPASCSSYGVAVSQLLWPNGKRPKAGDLQGDPPTPVENPQMQHRRSSADDAAKRVAR